MYVLLLIACMISLLDIVKSVVVVFKEPRQVRTDTGGVQTEYVEVLRCRAYKRRFSNVTDKDKIEAHKEFYGHFGVFQVRYHPRIREDQILEYRGVEYKIILLDNRNTSHHQIMFC